MIKVTIEITGKTFDDILHGLTMARLGLRKNLCGTDAHRGATYTYKTEGLSEHPAPSEQAASAPSSGG